MATTVSEPIDREYPMPSYVAAWKTYRTLSDEDQVIAKRLANAIILPGPHSRIVDVGPGDGRVLVRFLVRLNETPAAVTVVEPNEEFCAETVRAVHYEDFEKELIVINKKLGECSEEELAGHAIVTCTHTAYFLTDAELERLLELVRNGAKLYIVIDHPESIFSRLWRHTAPTFHERVSKHLATIKSLDPARFAVAETVISAEISDPMTLRRPISNLVMSMLCYAEVDDMTNEQFAAVRNTISSMTTEGRIFCESLFFEITAKRPLLRSVA